MNEKKSNEEILKSIIGKTINSIDGLQKESDEVVLRFADGTAVTFLHFQDCCEYVRLYDFEITRQSVDDLVEGIVNDASESVRCAVREDVECVDDSGTWTFYNINTSKGCINMRWLGESNGYYSEKIDILDYELPPRKEI